MKHNKTYLSRYFSGIVTWGGATNSVSNNNVFCNEDTNDHYFPDFINFVASGTFDENTQNGLAKNSIVDCP